MSSRLRVFSSVCLFAVLFSIQVLAQSNSASSSAHRTRSLKLANGLKTPALSFAGVNAYDSDGNGANAVAVADLNGDGQADMVVTNWCSDGNCTSGSVVVLMQSNGFFTPTQYPSGGLFADSVAVADVNGDGKPDLIVANCGSPSQTNCVSTSNSGNVAVLLGNGDGTFQAAVTYTLGASGASAVAVADVNRDGKPDLIVATGSNTAGLVGVLLGNGNGTFQAEATYGSGGLSPLAVAVGNLGNGRFDVVVANECADDTCTSSNVGVLVGNGNGTFQTAVAYGSGGLYSDGVAIADVNRDGKPDVVVANSSTSTTVDNGNVGVLLGNGNGTLQTAVPYGSGAFGAASVAVADVNGDGILDLVVANCSSSASSCVPAGGNVGVLLGIGNGTFRTAVTYSAAGNAPFAVTLGDVNGDGRPDIVAASCASNNCGAAAGTVGVLINTTSPWLVYASLARQVDYFGEGTADFTVWRPTTGTLYSEDYVGKTTLAKKWGENGDVPVIGDYDGDGKTDIAVWRPSNGTWYYVQSSNGQQIARAWGAKGDIPVPGDYDGDGKTDLAVFRPSTGIWYIIQSSNGQQVARTWGANGDIPVPGDYDGDGKTDVAVWSPSNGTWYIILSSTGKGVSGRWGTQGDIPVAADYDGDGKTDLAVWRPSNGTWYVIKSNTGAQITVNFGITGDVPVPRDYDGDLKADFAVWRPSNGTWYVVQSSNDQQTAHSWGVQGDIPLNKPVGQ
jgi:hypothetical protein